MNDDTIDLRDRLRSAAGSLAAAFDGELTVDLAEALVLHSAEGLLAAASVTDFVPILAERRARRAVRSGLGSFSAPVLAGVPLAPSGPPPTPPVAAPAVPTPAAARALPAASAAPLLAVSGDDLGRLRERVEQARTRVAEWQADLTRR